MAELTFDNIETPGVGVMNESYTPIDPTPEEPAQEQEQEQEQNTADGQQAQEPVGQESVGGEQEQGAPSAEGGGGDSSSANFFSTVADALRREGALQFLQDEDIASITDPDTFKEAMRKEAAGYRTESENMLMEAFGLGADVKELQMAQGNLEFLKKVDPNSLDNDSDKNIQSLRHDLIVNHYLSLGLTPEQAEYEFTKSRDTNNDIKDAKFALEQQTKFFETRVNGIMEEARRQEQQHQLELQQSQQRVTDNIMNNKGMFESLQLDKRIRSRIVDAIYTPKVQDASGKYYSELQSFQNQHPEEFLQMLGAVYVLTDGGKDFSRLSSAIAKKEKNNSIKNLENVLRGQKGADGGMTFVANGRPAKTEETVKYKPVF